MTLIENVVSHVLGISPSLNSPSLLPRQHTIGTSIDRFLGLLASTVFLLAGSVAAAKIAKAVGELRDEEEEQAQRGKGGGKRNGTGSYGANFDERGGEAWRATAGIVMAPIYFINGVAGMVFKVLVRDVTFSGSKSAPAWWAPFSSNFFTGGDRARYGGRTSGDAYYKEAYNRRGEGSETEHVKHKGSCHCGAVGFEVSKQYNT